MIMDVKYKIPPTVSMECADLIKKMLQRLPEKRISIFDIQNHEWIRGWAEEGEQGEGEVILSCHGYCGESFLYFFCRPP